MADINSQLPAKLTDGTLTATIRDTGTNDSLNVAVVDASGAQITNFSGSGVSHIDDAAFAAGTDDVVPAAGFFNDSTPDSVNEGDAGAVRMSANRNLYVRVRDNAGNERGMNVDASGNAAVIAAANSGVDIGDVTINNASGASAVNIQDGGNSITIDGTVTIGNAQVANDVHSYDTTASVAASGTDNHDYTIGNTALLLKSLHFAASGKMKVEFQAGPVAGLTTRGVWFTSSANPSMNIVFGQPIEVASASTGTIRLIRTNLEASAMDVYSSINGVEV